MIEQETQWFDALTKDRTETFEAEEVAGEYTKEVTREFEQGDITVQWITLRKTHSQPDIKW